MPTSNDKSHNDYERKILDNIEEHGWFCTSVFEDKGKTPSFSYSVGFTKTPSSPEFIVFGLETGLMHKMLWEVFHQIKDGRIPSDNQRWSNVLQGHDYITEPFIPQTSYETISIRRCGSGATRWIEPAL
jgi:hypothetical protein